MSSAILSAPAGNPRPAATAPCPAPPPSASALRAPPPTSLYIGIFETRDFHLTVRANGVDLPVALAHRDNDLSEFRATLPPAALAWNEMEITLTADRAPLTFGYLEVR